MEKRFNYVVGFLHDGTNVVLIKKTKPEWQAGKLNGVGGKIEWGELPVEAMQREFKEETGLHIDRRNWEHFATLTWDTGNVYMFRARFNTTILYEVKSMTEEEVGVFDISEVVYPNQWDTPNVVPNLRWLLPMAVGLTNAHPVTIAEIEDPLHLAVD